ncbi:hypothetical protein [Rhodococcus wratislaviensis]|uniref:hypothetical protein n=1 Tax=Rhodococcus wratislaviensis TaxID=44752 RepID=UPI003661A278
MFAGDPAWDLTAAWVLRPAGAASRFFEVYAHADAATIRRAQGLAALKAFSSSLWARTGNWAFLARQAGIRTCRPDGARSYSDIQLALAFLHRHSSHHGARRAISRSFSAGVGARTPRPVTSPLHGNHRLARRDIVSLFEQIG